MTVNEFSDLTQDHFVASVQWMSLMSAPARWNLTDEEVSVLLGIDANTYRELKRKAEIRLPLEMSKETLERLSLLLGISRLLTTLAPATSALEWFNRPNASALLQGQSIKNYLLQNRSISDFYAVNQYLAVQ